MAGWKAHPLISKEDGPESGENEDGTALRRLRRQSEREKCMVQMEKMVLQMERTLDGEMSRSF